MDYVKGIFKNRPNRFIAEVEVDGSLEIAHVPNTGRCKELLVEGAVVWLKPSDNPNRKTKFSLHFVENKGVLVSLFSQEANSIVYDAITSGKIKELAGQIKFDDDYENIIVDKSAKHGNGAYDAYTLNMHRGNVLEALVDTWLESGDLWEQEELFLEVLKKVGITDAEYRNPDARYEKVYDTWLKITNPFDTDNADQAFYDGLSSWKAGSIWKRIR